MLRIGLVEAYVLARAGSPFQRHYEGGAFRRPLARRGWAPCGPLRLALACSTLSASLGESRKSSQLGSQFRQPNPAVDSAMHHMLGAGEVKLYKYFNYNYVSK